MKVVAGVDVGKSSLDVSVSAGPARRFANSPDGIVELERWLQSKGVTEVVCESTGGYEREVVRVLSGTDMSVHVAHPIRVRSFARASGYEAKTDRLDARVLSRYGEVFDLAIMRSQSVDSEELRDLLNRRRQLVEQRAQERNRLDKGVTEGVRASTERHIEWLDEEIGGLEEEYRKVLEDNARLSESAALYRSVPGVGDLTAATLVAYLPELGKCNGKELSSLVGVAPWSRDSGLHHGYRSIRGGRGRVRRVLYLSALSAIRCNDDLRSFYRGLRRRGKPGKVALVAVMRKLLLLLNAIARRGTPWAEHYSPAS